MAMLAAPRRKQKVINLRAKNNAWSNDPNKFGQRMLEKMGWSEGKGLGANENGIIEHVVARYKNDDKGLGYEDKNDQWTKHEDDFNSLLANLSNGNVNEEKLHSGVSLEVKSKKSKARVHYHKFTRGKDLTRYSEKDLANIFGKKSLKNLKTMEKQEESEKVDCIKTTEQIFTDKGSMVDYFKNKLSAFKSKNNVCINEKSDNEDKADFAFKGFSGTGILDKYQTDDYQEISNGNEINNKNSGVENAEIMEKTRKKKDKYQAPINIDNGIDDNMYENTSEGASEKKSKKNKKRDNPEILVEEPIHKKKKKKSKIDSIEEHTDHYVPKKKKKRKNKDVNNE